MKNLSKIVVASSLLTCAAAQAGGLYLYETTASDIGLASAGMAARAQDASVMAANPAGLANVSGKSFSGNLIGLYGDAQLDTMTGDAGNVIGFVPMASAFYSQQVNDKWTLGIGLYGNYGLGLEYEGLLDNHLDIPTATTQALTIQPSASYRINDHWSVGAALGIQYGMYEVEGTLASSGVHKKYLDEDQNTQVNGRVGVLYEATSGTRLGLSYSSETEFEFDNSNSIAPQQLIFSAYHEVNDDLAVMWNVNWQDWSEYTTVLKAADLVDVETQDTYQIALGTQYKLNEKMVWNAGFAFDTSMYESQSNGDITVPTGKAYRIGTGIDYKLDSENSIGFAFEAVLMESSETETPRLQAGFDEPALYFMSMSYNWKN
ncbi:OmpP1/FadL family transporter [Vibrio diabolicus]|uniref:OmpP1/FadL family transporter n=1 Tax=Vibrio diabolicus TaxID=50719 RepID=UPI003751D8B2